MISRVMIKDVIVIGGGPGGYVAAIRAAQLGLSVLVVEKEHLGGVCLNWGCIPTKSLLTSAEVYHQAQHLADFGVSVGDVTFDLEAMVARSRRVSEQLSKGVSFLLKKHEVEVMSGTASLVGQKQGVFEVAVAGKKTLKAKHVIVASGGRPVVPPSIVVDGQHVWTSKEAMVQKQCPASLVVVGSGAIGLEFASFYAHLGAQVTVVEAQSHLLPSADAFISESLLKAFKKRKIACQLGRRFTSVKIESDGCVVTLDNKKTLKASAVLLALGVRANTEDLGLEDLGVAFEHGRVAVGPDCQTNVPGLYAIGDVTAGPWLAHKASHEGVLCAETIAGQHPHKINVRAIPACVYSAPQIASVGLTEAEAKAAGHQVKVGLFPFQANGKALAMGAGDGGIKTLVDEKTGEILGAHMIGPGVTELISNIALAMTGELTEAEVLNTVFPHPTLSEALHESLLAAMDRGIHY